MDLISKGFKLEEHIDPKVKRYFGSYLPDPILELLQKVPRDNDDPCVYPVQNVPLVWVNHNLNDDISEAIGSVIPDTYRVEIGIKSRFGIFGSSSAFCHTIESAMEEATYDLLYRLTIVPKGIPALVCYRRRL